MKKYLILLAVAVLLLAGCTYESYDNNYYGSDDPANRREDQQERYVVVIPDNGLPANELSGTAVQPGVILVGAIKLHDVDDEISTVPMPSELSGGMALVTFNMDDVLTGFTPNVHAGDHEYWLVVDELQEPVGDGTVPLAMTGNKSWPDLPTEQIELLGNDIQLDTDSRAALEKLKKNLKLRGDFAILLDHDYSTEVTGYSQGGAMDGQKVLILMDAALYADKFGR